MQSPPSPLFACLDDCVRLAALNASGVGGGLILTIAHIDALLIAAAACFPALTSVMREGTLRSYLAPYIMQCPWRILYDGQRALLLASLGAGATPAEATVLTGIPKQQRRRSKYAAA